MSTEVPTPAQQERREARESRIPGAVLTWVVKLKNDISQKFRCIYNLLRRELLTQDIWDTIENLINSIEDTVSSIISLITKTTHVRNVPATIVKAIGKRIEQYLDALNNVRTAIAARELKLLQESLPKLEIAVKQLIAFLETAYVTRITTPAGEFEYVISPAVGPRPVLVSEVELRGLSELARQLYIMLLQRYSIPVREVVKLFGQGGAELAINELVTYGYAKRVYDPEIGDEVVRLVVL